LDYTLPLAVEMYPSEKLRAKNLRIGTFDEELETLAAEMFKIMYR
jgi:peptide deformylase